MVNFTSQLDWVMGCPEDWLNFTTLCVSEAVSGRDEHSSWWTEQSRWLSPVWVGVKPSRTWKGQRKIEFILHLIASSGISSFCLWCSGLLDLQIQTGINTVDTFDYQAFELHHWFFLFSSMHTTDRFSQPLYFHNKSLSRDLDYGGWKSPWFAISNLAIQDKDI